MGWQPPNDDLRPGSKNIVNDRELFLLQVELVVFILLAGVAIGLFAFMLLQDIWNCFTLGCSAMLPIRARYIRVEMPVHVHIAWHGGWLLFFLFLFRMGYSDLTEQIQERRAQREFDAVMQRIRSGEDIDSILADLKKRKKR